MTRKLPRLLLGFVLIVFFNADVVSAQSSEEIKELKSQIEFLRQEIEGLKGRQITIQKEFEEIKRLVREKQAPPQPQQAQEVILSVDEAPFRGDKNAKLTLIEFSDYQCPFCARHFREAFPLIDSEYISKGKVKYVFRDFPVASVHREAFKAAEAARCAGDQGKYWEMHDRLFVTQKSSPKDLVAHAQYLKLDLTNFQKCLDSGQQAMKIHKDLAEGQKVGIKGTSTFFLGFTEPSDSKIKVLKVIEGAQEFATFREAIRSLLSAQK
jgi:protein-disulfide isomerase